MQKWLENNNDAPSSLKAWGVQKETYTYTDFEEWVLNGGTLVESEKKRGKGKEKQILQEKESGSSKGKKHKKNKNL